MFREFDFENRPIVEIVDEILADANKLGASDIHFDPTPDSLNIRVRIDGELREYTKVPDAVKKNLLTRVKIISGMNITETRLPQDGAMKGSIDTYAVDMRVSSLPIVDGEKIVIRLLDYSKSMEGLENLQFSPTNLEKIIQGINAPNGIILVTGATGSGKSTTVYSILQRLNDVKTNIITVEDPVEMKISGINQVQVMSEIGLTFGAALRSILRQDPDTIMIGEIRDDETARIAVRASITGHLVLSTIHTNNALTTIERLLDMEVERYLLGSALNTIVAQRLAKKLCTKCRKEVTPTEYQKRIFKKVLNKDVDKIYEPNGCSECFEGYKGRIGIHEVLSLDQEIRDAIIGNSSKQELRELVYKDGKTITMFADGLEKVVQGDTSFEEILSLIDITEDIDENDKELKDAILGVENAETLDDGEAAIFDTNNESTPPVDSLEEVIETEESIDTL
jgi:type IV pilus assembly protein PilB